KSGLPAGVLEHLAEADAFRSMGLDRRAALWAVRALDPKAAPERLPLFERPEVTLREHEPETTLPPMPAGEHVIRDYRAQSFSLKAHPLSFLRDHMEAEKITPNGRLPCVANGRPISVAGLVLIRQ